MLNATSIKTLKQLKKANFQIANLKIKNINSEIINATLLYLQERQYISCFVNDDNEVIAVIPEYKGKHYFEFQRAELKQFLIKSILTPILVSTITTIVALQISRYF